MITKISYSFIFIVSSIFIAVLIALVISSDDPSLYSPAGILISAVAALTAAIATIKSNRHTFMQNNSLAFIKALTNDKRYHKSLVLVRKAINNRLNVPLESFATKNNGDPQTFRSIQYVLNTWELAGAACRNNLYDEKHLYESHKSAVIGLGLMFRDYIHKIQVERENPDIYYDFTWLTLHWTIRRDAFEKVNTRKALIKVYRDLNRIRAGKLTYALRQK